MRVKLVEILAGQTRCRPTQWYIDNGIKPMRRRWPAGIFNSICRNGHLTLWDSENRVHVRVL